jgi:hypothetical protein
MMQASAGQQVNQTPENEFLSNYVGGVIKKLQSKRNPTDWYRIANGSGGQAFGMDNPQDFGNA